MNKTRTLGVLVLFVGSLGCGSSEATSTAGSTHAEVGHGAARRAGNGEEDERGQPMHGGGMGGGHGGPRSEIRDTFHALLDHHEAIVRRVEDREDGIASVTTSEDPEVVELLRRHVREIASHMQAGGSVRRWDPLFAALGENYQDMLMEIEDVPGGVAVVHRGRTAAAVALIHAHAQVVSDFAEHGYDEARREHPTPEVSEHRNRSPRR